MNSNEQAWIVAEWLSGRSQVEIGDELGVSSSVACSAIKAFLDQWADVNVMQQKLYNDGRKAVARVALKKYFKSPGNQSARKPTIAENHEIELVRNAAIVMMRELGATYRQIGEQFNISFERVRQITIRAERKKKRIEQAPSLQSYFRIEDVPLEQLDLSVRARNCLKNGGCYTVGDAMKLTDAELFRMPNFGNRSLREWKMTLEKLKATFLLTRAENP